MTITPVLRTILFLSLVSARIAAAEVVSVTPVADAFVVSASPTSNYGGAGGLSVTAPGLPKGEFQSVLRYDTSVAKTQFDTVLGAGQWSVTKMTLQWTAAAPGNPIFNATAAGQFAVDWMQNDAWVEGTGTPGAPTTNGITFATLPSFLSPADQTLGTFPFDGSISGTFTYTPFKTSGAVADIAAGSMLSLRVRAADAQVSYVFNARSFGVAASRPLLIITAEAPPRVPAASAALMWGLALLLSSTGSVMLRRRLRA